MFQEVRGTNRKGLDNPSPFQKSHLFKLTQIVDYGEQLQFAISVLIPRDVNLTSSQ
jgi:hypothetical protein